MTFSVQTITASAAGISVLAYLWACAYRVPAGHRALIFNSVAGIKDAVIGEGLRFRIFGLEVPHYFNVRTQVYNTDAAVADKNGISVSFKLRILYRPDQSRLPMLYKTFGMSYADRTLPISAHQVLRSIVAEYSATEVLQERMEVKSRIVNALSQQVGGFGVMIDDVALVEIDVAGAALNPESN